MLFNTGRSPVIPISLLQFQATEEVLRDRVRKHPHIQLFNVIAAEAAHQAFRIIYLPPKLLDWCDLARTYLHRHHITRLFLWLHLMSLITRSLNETPRDFRTSCNSPKLSQSHFGDSREANMSTWHWKLRAGLSHFSRSKHWSILLNCDHNY